MPFTPHTHASSHASRRVARLLLPISLSLVLILLGSLAFVRARQVEQRFGNSETCSQCFFHTTFSSDLWLIGLGATLAASMLVFRHVLLRAALSMGLLFILVVTVADTLLYSSLAMRIQLTDVFKFGMEFNSIVSFLQVYFSSAWPWVVGTTILLTLAYLVAIVYPSQAHPWLALGLSLLAVGCVAGATAGSSRLVAHVHQETTRNWFLVNLDQGVARPYSDDFVASLRDRTRSVPHACSASTATKTPNVLVVVVESLSSYHSALLGGHDWTPSLDGIAREHSWFTDFHANGFTTDQGLIALLTGRFPLPSVGRYGSTQAYAGFEGDRTSLPGRLRRMGVDTLFFTTGDLRFLAKGEWAKSIGFTHVEGAEHPFYEGHPRLHFNAAADALLFDRFLGWKDERTQDTPYFATLLTVSSHPPFVTPDGRVQQEEAVIRYVDGQLGRLYAALQQRYFFETGILVITGDHRAMTPLGVDEVSAHGERSLSRVPLVVVGQPAELKRGAIDTLAQQADFSASLLSLTGNPQCRPADRGNFLTPVPIEPAFVAHVRGDRRSWINVYTGMGDGVVQLDGDRTRWISSVELGERIIDHINTERIALGEAVQDWLTYMMELRQGKRAF